MSEVNSGNFSIGPSGYTVSSFAESRWKDYLDLRQVRPSTRASYESMLKNHVFPAIGPSSIVGIRADHVSELLRKASEGRSPK